VRNPHCTFLFLVILFLSGFNAEAEAAITANVHALSVDCLRVLHAPTTQVDYTGAVISSLKELLDRKLITPKDLTEILSMKNPLISKTTSLEIEFGSVIDQVIEAIDRDRENLEPLVQKLFTDETNNVAARNKSELNTKDHFARLNFYPIEPGEFWMGSPKDEPGRGLEEKYRKVNIETRFWIANFPVTQWQYAMVMGDNPSKPQLGTGSIELEVEVRHADRVVKVKLQLQPNHPVTNIADENEFIARLNDLSKRDDSLIYKIIPDHVKFSAYAIPTSAEWEFVARNRGAWMGLYPDGINSNNLGRIAWYSENSNGHTHPVGELEPIWLDGQYPIYDLYGNVFESTADRISRGGSYGDSPAYLRAAAKAYFANSPEAFGLRLKRLP